MQMKKGILDAVCLAGLIALIAAGSLASIKLALVKVRSAERKNTAIAAHLSELRKAKTVLRRLDSAIQANQTALAQLRTRLPESKSLGKFLSDLDAMLDRSSVDLSKVTPGAPVAEALCNRTPLSFSCRGAFPDLHAVLYGLETQERVVRIDRVSISRGDAPGECKMEVSCSVYGR